MLLVARPEHDPVPACARGPQASDCPAMAERAGPILEELYRGERDRAHERPPRRSRSTSSRRPHSARSSVSRRCFGEPEVVRGWSTDGFTASITPRSSVRRRPFARWLAPGPTSRRSPERGVRARGEPAPQRGRRGANRRRRGTPRSGSRPERETTRGFHAAHGGRTARRSRPRGDVHPPRCGGGRRRLAPWSSAGFRRAKPGFACRPQSARKTS